jgi:hypothetical protein
MERTLRSHLPPGAGVIFGRDLPAQSCKHNAGERMVNAKQMIGDIVLATIILLALLIAMGLMSDDDAEVFNQPVASPN